MTWRHVANFLAAIMAAGGALTTTVQGIASDAHALDWPALVVAGLGAAILVVDKWVASAPAGAAEGGGAQASPAPSAVPPAASPPAA